MAVCLTQEQYGSHEAGTRACLAFFVAVHAKKKINVQPSTGEYGGKTFYSWIPSRFCQLNVQVNRDIKPVIDYSYRTKYTISSLVAERGLALAEKDSPYLLELRVGDVFALDTSCIDTLSRILGNLASN